MDTATVTLLAGSVVVIGRWAEDKPIDAKLIIGIVGSALGATLVGEMNEELGRAFGLLILITVSFTYLPVILNKSGLANIKTK